MAEGLEVDRERRRKRKLADELRKLERYRSAAAVQIPVKPETFSRRFPDLPEGVVFSGGQLIVESWRGDRCLQRARARELFGRRRGIAAKRCDDRQQCGLRFSRNFQGARRSSGRRERVRITSRTEETKQRRTQEREGRERRGPRPAEYSLRR